MTNIKVIKLNNTILWRACDPSHLIVIIKCHNIIFNNTKTYYILITNIKLWNHKILITKYYAWRACELGQT